MALSKYRLGELIELCDERNEEEKFSINDVRGISTGKAFIDTKANMDGVSLLSYKIVNHNEFAYVADTSRRGDKIALAFNTTENSFIISAIYTVFRVSRKDILLSDYLFIFFNRPEFDRYSRFNSWGSARETFDWDTLCDIEITLPPIEIQQKYVAIYKAMQENLSAFESRLDDLKLVCDGYIDKIKHTACKRKVGDILEIVDERNTSEKFTEIKGINISKQFMLSVASVGENSLHNYKIVKKGQFVFSGMQTGRDECIRIALLQDEEAIIVSPAYLVLKCKDENTIAEYIMLWFSRKQVDRYGWFASDGSIRTNLDNERLFDMEIPIPDIKIQQSIVNVFRAYLERQRIADEMREQLKKICPVLIKGSIEEGA